MSALIGMLVAMVLGAAPALAQVSGGASLDLAIARLIGGMIGKLADPLGWVVVAGAMAAGAFIASRLKGVTAAIVLATVGVGVNVVLAQSWWAEIGGNHASRIEAIWLALMGLALSSWMIGRTARFALTDTEATRGHRSPDILDTILGASFPSMRPNVTVPAHHWRHLIAGTVVWIVAVIAVFLVFEPFGRYSWRDSEWFRFMAILFGPAVIGAMAVWLFNWARQGRASP